MFSDKFQAMLDSREGANSIFDFGRSHARKPSGDHRGKHIFQIVRAGEWNRGLLENDFFFAVVAENDLVVQQECTLSDALFAAEPEDFRLALERRV